MIERIDALAAERDADDARALFERAGARDSAGLEAEAEPLYRRALARGLDDDHRAQAVIQLASTLRNLGRIDEASAASRRVRTRAGRTLHDAAAAFYALALVSAATPCRGIRRSAGARPAPAALHALGPATRRLLRGERQTAHSAQGEHGRVAARAPVDSMRRPRNQE